MNGSYGISCPITYIFDNESRCSDRRQMVTKRAGTEVPVMWKENERILQERFTSKRPYNLQKIIQSLWLYKPRRLVSEIKNEYDTNKTNWTVAFENNHSVKWRI